MPDLTDSDYWDTAILRAAGRLLMLAALDDRPGHGYDIARRLTGMCGDWCKPSPAMIYPAIQELERDGLISCETELTGRRKRRVCELTDEGRAALRVGVAAWARFLPTIEQLVGTRSSGSDASASPGRALFACGDAPAGAARPVAAASTRPATKEPVPQRSLR